MALFDVLNEQLGLVLQSKKGAEEVLVWIMPKRLPKTSPN